MPNPFRLYPQTKADDAVRYGIVGDVAKSTGFGKDVVSRTFRGSTLRPKPELVKALNSWLTKNGYPAADASGKTARAALDELRKKV